METTTVATRAIQAAAQGREPQVLEALGINWRAGTPHITCPYPSHADGDPSWRWNEKRARAFCTCLKGAHSIFDVVMAIDGCDFAAAKLRVAEILDRPDLIQFRSPQPSGTFQATDARSLLEAPASHRDDTLPIKYLASRLGIEPGQVPVPTTPMVGLKALGYYDPPPAGSKGKPRQVGLYPCAVFGTEDAEGGSHALRIYVAPEGQGKAVLGNGPNGRPRDPKKAAKILDGSNTAGRAALWGRPAQAPRIILCEGVETAAAVALAFWSEIVANEIAVAAAISATGMEAFQPWPATREVIVGADRDDGPKDDGRPGSGRGEAAARSFALEHYQALASSIALPGQPGETLDWLDLLRNQGVGAVRAGILAAEPFRPTPQELAEGLLNRRRRAELVEIVATYPLPALYTTLLSYRHTSNHEVWVHKCTGRDDDGTLHWLPVSSPFGIAARLRHADQADAYGLRVMIRDMAGQSRPIDIDRATLARMGATDIRALLLGAGLRVEGDGEMVAVSALKAAQPEREIITVSRPGWHDIEGVSAPVFVTLAGHALGVPERCDIELAAAVRASLPPAAGTGDGWRDAITAALSALDCPHWTLGVTAGFVAPLVSLLGLDTCGISLSGLSSAGKTIALKLAVSAWGTPKLNKGLLQSMRTTENALEALARNSHSTVLALDELAHVDGKAMSKMIYGIASGSGKSRMSQGAILRPRSQWQTFALLSGETSLEEKIRSDGGQFQAGMAVRIPDVDVTHVNRRVAPAILAAIDGIEQHYGHAGPAFVAELICHGCHRTPEPLRQRVQAAARRIAGADADSARVRAALPFALLFVAGELAKALGVIPSSAAVAAMVTWAWQRFDSSSDAQALKPDEQVINNIRAYIAERWDVTVKSTEATTESFDGTRRTNNRESVGWYDDGAIYLPTHRIREAAGNTMKEQQIIRVLVEHDCLLRRHDDKRAAVRWVPKVGRIAAYALKRSAFGRSNRTSDPDLTVIQGGMA
ncbi:MAG: DUF927 domain-containing protein [Azospirillum sp.]|nr:DUF927 domain-containing protein [Azospirillum sp.]